MPRRLAVTLVAVASLAACSQVPSPRLAPDVERDPVTASLLMRLSARQEAAVLDGIAPVMPSLLQQVWGLPPAGTPWRLEVMMTPWRLTPEGRMSYWIDAPAEPTARDEARLAFRHAMEAALTPPAPSRAWYVGDMRGVSVQQARQQGDSLIVNVAVTAGTRCADGRNVMRSIGYDVAFVRERKGTLRLVDQAPQMVSMTGDVPGQPAEASCTPKLLVGALDR